MWRAGSEGEEEGGGEGGRERWEEEEEMVVRFSMGSSLERERVDESSKGIEGMEKSSPFDQMWLSLSMTIDERSYR